MRSMYNKNIYRNTRPIEGSLSPPAVCNQNILKSHTARRTKCGMHRSSHYQYPFFLSIPAFLPTANREKVRKCHYMRHYIVYTDRSP
jgi:hypothetical protein